MNTINLGTFKFKLEMIAPTSKKNIYDIKFRLLQLSGGDTAATHEAYMFYQQLPEEARAYFLDLYRGNIDVASEQLKFIIG